MGLTLPNNDVSLQIVQYEIKVGVLIDILVMYYKCGDICDYGYEMYSIYNTESRLYMKGSSDIR